MLDPINCHQIKLNYGRKKEWIPKFGDKIEWGSIEDESLDDGYFIAELPADFKYLVCQSIETLNDIKSGCIA